MHTASSKAEKREKSRNRAYEVEAQEYVPWGTQHKTEE